MNFQDLRQIKKYALFLKRQGWQIERIKDAFVFIKKLPLLHISIVKIQRPNKVPKINLINKIAKKHHAIFVKLELFGDCDQRFLKEAGFKKDSWPLLPPKTLWIDLEKSEKEILADFDKNTRYDLRKSSNSGLKIKIISGDKLKENQLEDFYKFFKKSRKEKRLWIPQFNYLKPLFKNFDDKSFLLLAYFKEKIIAVVVLLFSKDMAFYYFSASDNLGNKLFAPTALIWQAIKLSKKQGKKVFDFEGIYDPRFKVTKPWQGFSHFKKGFGGEEKIFESFIKYYFPF